MDNKRTSKIEEECGKFRILIIGRANAGKTTILKRVCDTTEEPEVYDIRGEKIDPSILAASVERGEHDIENEMVFASKPGFCFHDSRGFESGGIVELDKVNAFITHRSHQLKLENRLHAIWYCIPMDDSRLFTAAEAHFFSIFGTGCVPVIAVFTKFDALDNKAFAILREKNLSRADARKGAPGYAITDFEQRHLNSFYDRPYPPKAHVYLRDMDKEDANCNELLRQTAGALDNTLLEKLLVSTQQNNLKLCTEYCFKRVILAKVFDNMSELFPSLDSLTEEEVAIVAIEACDWFPHANLFLYELRNRQEFPLIFKDMSTITGPATKVEQIILLGMAVAISAQYSFFLDNLKTGDAFMVALRRYAISSQRQAVAFAVKDIVVTMPSRLDKDTHDEWEKKTLQVLMHIACNNLLEPE